MAQVKIYGLKSNLKQIQNTLSDVIHTSVVETLAFPKEKKFHRFISLDADEMIFPSDKSEQYTIIEIMMMEGRSVETKKALIKSLFYEINRELKIDTNDIEICIVESPACNWGFRGMTGDEIQLNYKVDV